MTEGKALPTRDRWCLNIGSGLILAGAALAGIGQAFLQDPPAKFWKDWPPAGRAAAAAAGVVVLAGWMALNRRRAAQSVGGLDPRSAPLAGAGVALMMLGFFGQPLLTRWTGLTTPLHVFVAPIVVGMSLYFAAVVVSWDRLKAANPGAAKACARCKTAQVPAGAKCPACGDLGRVREAALVKACFFGGGAATFLLFFVILFLKVDPNVAMALYAVVGPAVGIPVYRAALKRAG